MRADDRLDAALQPGGRGVPPARLRDRPRRRASRSGTTCEAIFELYEQRNVPGRGRDDRDVRRRASSSTTLSRSVGGRLTLRGAVRALGAADANRSSGEVETPTETVRYLAVPGRARPAPTPRGVFVVAASLSAERDDVMEAVQLATLVLISVLLIASALAWVVAGRMLAPLRALDETARSISETDLTRRIPVSGDDEIAELARTFNAMVDRLEGAFASQRAFVSDASHELRTPITIVRGHLELLGDDPQERRETVALVTDELDRMSRFVDDLLLLAKAERSDFLRVERGRARRADRRAARQGGGPRPARLGARGARRGRAARRPPAAHAGGHGARAERRPAHRGRRRDLDRHRRRRRRGVAVGARQRPGRRRARTRTRIFERFARAAGSRRRSEGAGLGLAIVRAIAEAHGGRAELASQPGRRLDLHRRRARRLDRRSPVEPHPDRGGRAAAVVVPREGPAAAGYTTTVCDDGVRAAALARTSDFDLMILDIGLPGQDGFAVLRALQARQERLPVLILTARDEVEDMVAGPRPRRRRLRHQAVRVRRAARPRARAAAPDGRRRATVDGAGRGRDHARRPHAPRVGATTTRPS